MLIGTACGLLLLYSGLAVALAMDSFPRLTVLALVAVPLLVSLVGAYETLVVVVPTIALCFYTSSLGILACVVFVNSSSLRLGPRSSHGPSATPLCCLPTFTIIGPNYGLVPLLPGNNIEQRVRVMRSKRTLFSTSRRKSSDSIPAAISSTSTLPCFSVYCRPSGLTTSVSPLSARYFRRARFLHEHPAIYRHARIHLQHTEYLTAKTLITRLLHINASKPFEPLH